VNLYLVHHGEAVEPDVDAARPLSARGRRSSEELAKAAALRGARPTIVWHSGKLRARQTAEIYWRACNSLAELAATRDLQPDDRAEWMRDRVRHVPDDIMIVGHFPHLPRLYAALLGAGGGERPPFPPHAFVSLYTADEGETWVEQWRLEAAQE
jgi:phosphohistidine phosphatase